MFTTDKSFETINSAMPKDSEGWFGKQPPDLSLMARARGVDYLYSYLKGFYVDKTRPWGVNNLYLPSTAMPHVLRILQGLQKPVLQERAGRRTATPKWCWRASTSMTPGAMKPEEYDQFVRDIANFLDYAGEPVKEQAPIHGRFCDAVFAGVLCVRLLAEERVLEGRPLTQQRGVPFVLARRSR